MFSTFFPSFLSIILLMKHIHFALKCQIMEVSLKFLSIVFEFRVLQNTMHDLKSVITGEKNSSKHHKQLLGIRWCGFLRGSERDAKICPLPLPHDRSPGQGTQLFSQEAQLSSVSKHTNPIPCLPLQSFVNERKMLKLLGDHKRKMVLLSRQLKQTISSKPFHKSHLRACQKKIFQTTITIVSFGKWILTFHLVHQNLSSECNVCFCFLI